MKPFVLVFLFAFVPTSSASGGDGKQVPVIIAVPSVASNAMRWNGQSGRPFRYANFVVQGRFRAPISSNSRYKLREKIRNAIAALSNKN